jgi:hypothetical protein
MFPHPSPSSYICSGLVSTEGCNRLSKHDLTSKYFNQCAGDGKFATAILTSMKLAIHIKLHARTQDHDLDVQAEDVASWALKVMAKGITSFHRLMLKLFSMALPRRPWGSNNIES